MADSADPNLARERADYAADNAEFVASNDAGFSDLATAMRAAERDYHDDLKLSRATRQALDDVCGGPQ
ncbi:MAG TPA: hypothetical protein VM030_08985 [Acidimicrobiales bacterium]|nr:hypothetical protein [Acidimicrobiales bacterium]